jgi:hypothetical protein
MDHICNGGIGKTSVKKRGNGDLVCGIQGNASALPSLESLKRQSQTRQLLKIWLREIKATGQCKVKHPDP